MHTIALIILCVSPFLLWILIMAIYDYRWYQKIIDMSTQRYVDFLWHLHGLKIKDGDIRNKVIRDYLEFIRQERKNETFPISKFSRRLTKKYYNNLENLLEEMIA